MLHIKSLGWHPQFFSFGSKVEDAGAGAGGGTVAGDGDGGAGVTELATQTRPFHEEPAGQRTSPTHSPF